MGIVRFSDLIPGMTLGADIIGADGRLLLAAGTFLTDHHLRVLRKWGVEEAEVRGVTRDRSLAEIVASLAPDDADAVDARVARLFQRADPEHPAVRELMELTRRRMIAEVLEERADAS
jgi:hypothetical protein